MIIGKVVGTVISTRKINHLVGSKFLIVEPIEKMGTQQMVAVDNVGAGVGEIVLVAVGSAARAGCGNDNIPIDALVIGIVDDLGKICIT